MKLLVVDDEELTRIGVVSSVDWKAIGIDEVLTADDGVNGLRLARIHKPEIILCDVRMPRMTGIVMLERLEEILPDSVPIFMSGYSDKEYLKAAIRLKAVSYIEKPLNPDEIRSAVLEAMEQYRQKLRTRHGEALHSLELASRLTLMLAAPYHGNAQAIAELMEKLSLKVTPATVFTAIVVRVEADMEPDVPAMDTVYHTIRDFLEQFHLSCIFAEKRIQYLIYFVYGPAFPSEHRKAEIRSFFVKQYQAYRHFSITAGEPVTGISRAYQSYASAVILQQSSFFFPENAFLGQQDWEKSRRNSEREPLPENLTRNFTHALSSREPDAGRALLAQVFGYYDRNPEVLPNEAKDLYYRLFGCLDEAAEKLQMNFSQGENLVDTLENCFCFAVLHEKLAARTERFFREAQESAQENSTIFLIRDYIAKNYMKETLSVKDISAHVFLSASYVCTFFKGETGKTLNQYLTEYRMEKAKQLLEDPRYKIAEISSRVGYSDGNYFGKSFKKYTGLSPSEYREKTAKQEGFPARAAAGSCKF